MSRRATQGLSKWIEQACKALLMASARGVKAWPERPCSMSGLSNLMAARLPLIPVTIRRIAASPTRGCTGTILTLPKPALKRCKYPANGLWPGNQRHSATGPDNGCGSAKPGFEKTIGHHMRVSLDRVRVRRSCAGLNGGFMIAKSKSLSARPEATRRFPVSVTSDSISEVLDASF